MPERFAIYYAPEAQHPLWQKAAEWLGRDCLTGATFDTALPGIERAALTPLSVSARKYGFHATIKAPMALSTDTTRDELVEALAGYAAATEPVAIGPLSLELIGGGFMALIPALQSEELTDLAADVVETFEPFRKPLSSTDRERRLRGANFSERQVELLDQYGYPYVFEQFQMHMTLTDRLPVAEQQSFHAAAAEFFGPLASADTVLDRLVLFHEPEAGAPFVRLDDFVLTGETAHERIRAR
jgi:putative phosphonate metabolism protein